MSPLSCSDRVVPAADSSELKHENTASPLACFLYTVFPCPHPRGGMQGAQTIPTKLGGTVDTQGRAEGKELPSEVEGTREPRAGSAPPCAYRSMGQSLPSWVPQRIWDLEGPPLSPRPPPPQGSALQGLPVHRRPSCIPEVGLLSAPQMWKEADTAPPLQSLPLQDWPNLRSQRPLFTSA